ncbi:TMV resistance protein N-like [Cucurbita maxima]|uniref:TMV resistance protein N-like n=1 Tax=Cucurbita maxima TaxID=3661 RepID=A0A6J1KUG3_CUCMA|nr:TMV resistance protein N-like [Cucurbita maxima]
MEMQRSILAKAKHACAKLSSVYNKGSMIKLSERQVISTKNQPPFDVFISYRGTDTRRTIAGLLYDHLSHVGQLRPFLDYKSLSPGDNIMDKISAAVKTCRVGLPVFSPRYCESYYCLYELALMYRTSKCIVPIFCDMKPSQLRVPSDRSSTLQCFAWALDEAKETVGLSFDSTNGDWSELLTNASDAVRKMLEGSE